MAQAHASIVARRADIKFDLEAKLALPFRFEPDHPIISTPTGVWWPVDPDEIAAYGTGRDRGAAAT